MIIKRRYGFSILFREILPPLIILTGWDCVVVILFQIFHQEWMEQPALPFSLMGSALAIFLGIRNNAAYARWWEGRTLWGSITNNCRSFGREVESLLGGQPDPPRAMAAYPYILKSSLSGNKPDPEIQTLLDEATYHFVFSCGNPANALLYRLGQSVQDLVAERRIDGAVHGTVDRILSDLANAQGGLERIRNTPLPIQYSMLPNIVTHLFCILLPLSAVQTLGWITPLGSSIIGVLFQMLDRSGRNLQEPFRDGPHALPMLTMSRTIERDLLQPLGEIPHSMPTPRFGRVP